MPRRHASDSLREDYRQALDNRPIKRNRSAGLLLFRRKPKLEVLLGHPGGPFWRRNDAAWTVPKGEIEDGENELMAARREFFEETGYHPTGSAIPLGSLRQPGGKQVFAWAIEDNWDPEKLISNMFSMEWPPKSGRIQQKAKPSCSIAWNRPFRAHPDRSPANAPALKSPSARSGAGQPACQPSRPG